MRQDALPPWSSAWEVVKSEEILECFVHGEESPKHLVASDGSALLLRGGLLVLPRRLVHRGRFLKSWERRERLFERRARELEETLAAISGREQDLEKHLRALEFRVIRWRERCFERNVRREELQRSLDHLGEECVRLLEEREEVQGKLRNLEGDIRALETTLARARRALGKVREWKRREEEKKRAWERLLWEVHGMHKRGIELLQKFRENETTLKLLLGELGKCARALQGAFRALATEEALLAEREKMAQSLQVDVEARRQRERMLERQKERWIRERERLRFEKQRLSEEMARTKTALEALGDVACAVPGELEAMSLQELGAFLERERQALLGERVRRGAIEEYQELEARERDLRRQDAFFQSLLGLIRKELQKLEREVEQTFLSFLQNVQAAFGRYFQQVFPRGEASFAVHDGVHLEVQIPGKKKQGMALLSSGERTLVALCFLCACFEAFGAKMCFFDEIDANLDHTNSVLLARILREFSASRQVVVVTHKEEVMEVADRILGVTMSEPGVSRVLLCEGIAQAQEFSLGGE
jgi:chromosome segregation protein